MSEEKLYERPRPRADYIDVQIHKEDLATLVELLDSTTKFYEIASHSMANGNSSDPSTEAILKNRIQLLGAFNSRFKAHLTIGEPESRKEH